MPRGGKREGAGRKAGARNKRTEAAFEAAEKAAEIIEAVVPGAFTGDAHALLMAVYKDPSHDWPLRIDAAKAAVRYEKPALAAVDHGGGGGDGEIMIRILKAGSDSLED